MSTGLTRADLGPVVEEHGLRPGLRLRYAALAVVGAAASFVALAYGLFRWYYAYSRYGPAVVWRWSGPALLTAVGMAAVGTLGLILLLRTRRIRVSIHESGLVIERGSSLVVLPWVRVRGIYTAAYRDTLPWPSRRAMAELALAVDRLRSDGSVTDERIRLTRRIEALDALAEAIKKRIYPSLLAEYSRAFNEGQALAFGPVVLAPEGLRLNGRVHPWQEIGQAALARGRLILQPAEAARGRRLQLAAHRVPNVEVLLQLLEQVGQHR